MPLSQDLLMGNYRYKVKQVLTLSFIIDQRWTIWQVSAPIPISTPGQCSGSDSSLTSTAVPIPTPVIFTLNPL